MDNNNKDRLFGKTFEELKQIVSEYGLPSYSAAQIAERLYKKGAEDISEITGLSKNARRALSEKYTVGRFDPCRVQVSVDGTKKYLYEPSDGGKSFEAVYIPDGDRATLCISSQAGCRMGCRFCMTARFGFKGNLTAGEILTQIRNLPEFERLTNIVYMGMGEPADNIDEVLKSLEILTSDYGFGMSRNRITVSTIGITEGLKRFLEESPCRLAVSLHNPFDDERLALIPAQKMSPISEIVSLIRRFDFSKRRRLSFEYVMFAGINDATRHADALRKLVAGLECRINLIRFHKIPACDLSPSDEKTVEKFKNYLNGKGLLTTVRASRGEDIFAACGMLSASKT